jgi:hypothetical protein
MNVQYIGRGEEEREGIKTRNPRRKVVFSTRCTAIHPFPPTLQIKGRWESNINVILLLFMYSQKWNGAASLFPKQNHNVLLPNFHIHVSVTHRYMNVEIRHSFISGNICFSNFWYSVHLSTRCPQSTYVCRVCLASSKILAPPPPFPSSQCVLPRTGRRGGGGSIFWKVPAIGLASYSIISLRLCQIFSIELCIIMYI